MLARGANGRTRRERIHPMPHGPPWRLRLSAAYFAGPMPKRPGKRAPRKPRRPLRDLSLPPEECRYVVGEIDHRMRLDHYLQKHFPRRSRTVLHEFIATGRVLVARPPPPAN